MFTAQLDCVDLLIHSFMYNFINKFINNQVVRHGHSDCATFIIANVADATCTVRYTNGSTYRYTNVSRRALAKLVLQRNISVGRWINDNLLAFNCKAVMHGDTTKYDFNLHTFVPAV